VVLAVHVALAVLVAHDHDLGDQDDGRGGAQVAPQRGYLYGEVLVEDFHRRKEVHVGDVVSGADSQTVGELLCGGGV